MGDKGGGEGSIGPTCSNGRRRLRGLEEVGEADRGPTNWSREAGRAQSGQPRLAGTLWAGSTS